MRNVTEENFTISTTKYGFDATSLNLSNHGVTPTTSTLFITEQQDSCFFMYNITQFTLYGKCVVFFIKNEAKIMKK